MNRMTKVSDILIGHLIYKYSQQDYIKKQLGGITDEELYEAVVGLFSKGFLRIRAMEDGNFTVDVILDHKTICPLPQFKKKYSGRFEEFANLDTLLS